MPLKNSDFFRNSKDPEFAAKLMMPDPPSRQEVFAEIMRPLVNALNETGGGCLSLTDSLQGEFHLPEGPFCCIATDLSGRHEDRNIQRAHRKLLNLQEFTRLNKDLGLMTFELRQGVNTFFPSVLVESYTYLLITAPPTYDAELFRKYVQDLVRFVRLGRYVVPELEYNAELASADLQKTRQAWRRLTYLWGK